MQEENILQHFPVFSSYSKGDFTCSISFQHAGQLSEEQKAAIWEVFETNMKDVYHRDDQKWNPKEKRRELFDVSPVAHAATSPGWLLVTGSMCLAVAAGAFALATC